MAIILDHDDNDIRTTSGDSPTVGGKWVRENTLWEVADEAAMLALAPEVYDLAVRADQHNSVWIFKGGDPSNINDWYNLTGVDVFALVGAPNGLATLDAGGLVPLSQLPSLTTIEVYEVSSEAAQLSLTAQSGDIAVRTDENRTYIHNGGVTGTMADWNEFLFPETSTFINLTDSPADYSAGIGYIPVINGTQNGLEFADPATIHPHPYASTSHNHTGIYAPISHNHNTLYAGINHDHVGEYAETTHNHDLNYADIAHDHLGDYAAATHEHDGADITSGNFNVARGGTGRSTLTVGAVITGDGTADVNEVTGTLGQVLEAQGAGVQPQFVDHDHTAEFSAIGHDHAGVYSVTSHDHAGVYAPDAHNHDADYSAITHDHTGVYAPDAHNHDLDYSDIAHDHTGVYAPDVHAHAAADIISGTLSVLQGGTGQSTLTAHSIIVGNGTGQVGFINEGAANEVLVSNGTGNNPSFQDRLLVSPTFYTITMDPVVANTEQIIANPWNDYPDLLTIYLECKVGNSGYSAGTRIYDSRAAGASWVDSGFNVYVTTTNISITVGAAGLVLINPSTGDIVNATSSSWKIVANLYKFA